jgi:hypothetical protein
VTPRRSCSCDAASVQTGQLVACVAGETRTAPGGSCMFTTPSGTTEEVPPPTISAATACNLMVMNAGCCIGTAGLSGTIPVPDPAAAGIVSILPPSSVIVIRRNSYHTEVSIR